jgi:hypothetical protein
MIYWDRPVEASDDRLEYCVIVGVDIIVCDGLGLSLETSMQWLKHGSKVEIEYINSGWPNAMGMVARL